MKHYTFYQKMFVKDHYLKQPDKWIAKKLNKTAGSVQMFRQRNNMVKSRDSGQFKKGKEPWNKGIAYHAGGRSKETQFKKGHIRNEMKPGDIREWKDKSGAVYQYLKLDSGKRVHYGRWLYEKTHGKIPKSYILVYKDGNTLNTKIENLSLISRADHAKNNVNRKKAAHGLKRAWSLHKSLIDRGLNSPYNFKY